MTLKEGNIEVSNRLNIFVREKGWSKAAFGRAVGIHRQNVDRYLNGESDPSKIVIKLITHGINPDWLLTGEGEMMSDKQPFNGRTTEIKRHFKVEDGTENYYREGGPYMIPAIGPLMTPEKIKEGDVLIIDTRVSPGGGDFVLIRTKEGPKIEKYQPGSEIFGVVIKLIREHAILRQ